MISDPEQPLWGRWRLRHIAFPLLAALVALFLLRYALAQSVTATGTLIITKITIPASDTTTSFSFTPAATLGGPFSLKNRASITYTNLFSSVYSVTEAPLAGWDRSAAACSNGDDVTAIHVETDATVTCTFTNTQRGSLTIRKVTEPASDTSTSFSFTPDTDLGGAFTLTNGKSKEFPDVPNGSYTMSETVPSGWILAATQCNNNSLIGAISIAPGEAVTCTFTNRKLGKLAIHVVTNPSTGQTGTFNFSINGGLTPSPLSLQSGGYYTYTNVTPQSGYQITPQVPNGWALSATTCSNGTINNITIGAGETVLCTLTYTKLGTVIIRKVTEPLSDAATVFSFTTNLGAGAPFTLTNGTSKTFFNVPLGTYRIDEATLLGWSLVAGATTCSDNSSVTAITVGAGEIVTCTFTNRKKGQLSLRVITDPPNDQSTSFDFTLAGGLSPTQLSLQSGGYYTYTNVTPKSGYKITPPTLTGWIRSSASCNNNSPLSNITLSPGEAVLCTFLYTKRGSLVVRKITVPSPDRTDTTFTFTTSGLSPATFDLKNGQEQSFANLDPGVSYGVSEVSASGWQQSDATCSDGSALDQISIDPGEAVTCTVTNTGTVVQLTLTKDDNDIAVGTGDLIPYVLRYANLGTQHATDVVLIETVPAHTTFQGPSGWSCTPNTAAGATCTYPIGNVTAGGGGGQTTFEVRVDDTIPAGVTQITNTAHLDYAGGANVAQSSESTPVSATPGLRLSKSDQGEETTPGAIFTYTLTYNNRGDRDDVNVVITETIPLYTKFYGPTSQWNCPNGTAAGQPCIHTVGALAVNQRDSVIFQVRVDHAIPAGVTMLENRAVIGSPSAPNAGSGSAQTPVNATPDLVVAVRDSGGSGAPGALIVYEVRYSNQGNQAASGVILQESLPTHTTFYRDGSSAGWSCNISLCQLPIGDLAGGESGFATFAVRVNTPLPAGVTSVVNVAGIQDDGTNGADPTPADNQASLTTSLTVNRTVTAAQKDILLEDKDEDGKPSPGDVIEYQVEVRNNGAIGVRQVIYVNELDPNTKLAPGVQSSQGAVILGNESSDQRVEVNLGELAGSGGSATVTFHVTIISPFPSDSEMVSNQGTVRFDDQETVQTDDPDTATPNDATVTAITATAQLEASLRDFLFVDEDQNGLVSGGDVLIYRLAVANQGNRTAGDVLISDIPDAKTQLRSGSVSTSRGQITRGNRANDTTVEIALDELPGDSTVTVTISFQVYVLAGQQGVISNQAGIQVNQGFPTGAVQIPSDDPESAPVQDPTLTPIGDGTIWQALYLPLIVR
ncbi:MAG: hypothetical protein R3C14_09440 [Caldilineaceae bacterium]